MTTSIETAADWARQYAEKGFSIIPLGYRTKTPALHSWKEFQERKADEGELVKWFEGTDSNIGVVTGKISGITVVDFDTIEAYEKAKGDGLLETPTAKTAKGFHCYFKHRPELGNIQNKEGGYDIRNDGGYVVAEPSVHPTGAIYSWVDGKGLDDIPLAELPESFAENSRKETELAPLYKGIPEGGRNISMTKIAGSLISDGLTIEECLAVLLKVNESNRPPLAGREVAQVVKSIYDKHNTKKVDVKSCLLKWNDISKLDIKTEYLLEGLVPKGGITLLFGRGGIGKTSICMQIAQAVAEGKTYEGRATIQTPVYLIDFENPLTVLKDKVCRIGEAENLWVWHISSATPPPRLDSKEWELYKQLDPGLIVIDTLRAAQLSDENDSRQMAIVIARLKELREMGFTILLLHHTPKGNENTYKGSTAILDLVDNVIGLEEVKENGVQ